MRQFTSKELRKTWIDFYKERGHVDVGAVSLVSDGSTGVMFNVAGMQPLMPYLLGEKHPMGTRLCNVQGCVRTNDIDSVGDKSHVTFFEMMGSWSLGDYFKEERCKWSYELLTQVFGFDKDHLASTVFAGDENAPRDEEGANYRIASGFKPENIYYLPAKDNWWGLEYGPCGPDSEMFYIADVPDCGPDCGPGCDCGKYTELGNDVFMQYEKHHDGTLTPLKQKNVDTGWGLERILAFLNGTKDVYQTDLFTDAIAFIENASGTKYEADEKLTKSMRILADHMRTSVMLIGDAAKLLPSNVGAGYVLRRLIRRAVRHGRTLGLSREKLLELAAIYIDKVYDDSYPLLTKNREFIISELDKEIARFESTLENGMKEFKKILDEKKENADKAGITGDEAFYLYDTFGFPLELTVEMAGEEGIAVDEKGFDTAMDAAKQRARENQNFSQTLVAGDDVFASLDDFVVSVFTGYDKTVDESEIAALAGEDALKDSLSEGEKGIIITYKTPFYATMGGQTGDTGVIETASGTFKVEDTSKLKGNRVAHTGVVVSGTIKSGDKAALKVDSARRASICKNHSATHLLQKALKTVLGDHVEQAGSLVEPGRLRFDFSHNQAMTSEEIKEVEAIVNKEISEDLKVNTEIMSLEDAKKTGAMALFGEKYGEEVRVVNMGDWSIELCGGTHVPHTSVIGTFKIISEQGIAAGVRRIEALTADGAAAYYADIEARLLEAAKAAKTEPMKLTEKIASLMDEIKALQSENQSLKDKMAKAAASSAEDSVVEIGDVKVLPMGVQGVDPNALRNLGDEYKAKLGKAVVIMASDLGEKVSLVVMASDDAVKAGVHAGNIIKAIAPIVGGGGGGRPNMAQAGGKDASKIQDALNAGVEEVRKQIG
ncbi:alanyl-tRNA synthetase [Lachnospiraceae bacterium]|nr:alanyl-tRNA synthetase [Lachnospiraceae bacterium]